MPVPAGRSRRHACAVSSTSCGGCPAIGASHAANLTVRNVVLDTARLPFTHGVVAENTAAAAAAADAQGNQKLTLRLDEPERSEWDMVKYPWLQYLEDDNRPVPTPGHAADFAGFSSSKWDAAAGTVVLTYVMLVMAVVVLLIPLVLLSLLLPLLQLTALRRYANASRQLPKPGRKFGFKHFENMQAGWGVFGWMVTGRYLLDGVTLRSCAGMGYRCDFCSGTFELRNSTIAPVKTT